MKVWSEYADLTSRGSLFQILGADDVKAREYVGVREDEDREHVCDDSTENAEDHRPDAGWIPVDTEHCALTVNDRQCPKVWQVDQYAARDCKHNSEIGHPS